MNKRGQVSQFPILTAVGIILLLLFLAPFMLKIVNDPLDKFQDAITNQSTDAGEAVGTVKDTFLNFWDTLIIIAFTITMVLLLISAFLIDVHPIFSLLYILLCFFTMIFAPMVLDVLDQIYEHAQFSGLVGSYLPLTSFVRSNFAVIILSIMVLSGIIMYAKFKFRSGGP